MNWWPAAGLCAGLLTSDIVLPIPSTIVMVWCGATLGFAGGTAAAWTGLTGGASLGYLIGASAGSAALERFAGAQDGALVTDLVRRRATWALAALRAVPMLAEVSVIMVGIARMRWARFFFVVSLANLGVALVYAGLGALADELSSLLLASTGAIGLPSATWFLARRIVR
jgi:uncharacterized membrane protein YdjX (TVP38/TMEM64 family)